MYRYDIMKHWNGKIITLIAWSSLETLKAVIMTAFNVSSDDQPISLTTIATSVIACRSIDSRQPQVMTVHVTLYRLPASGGSRLTGCRVELASTHRTATPHTWCQHGCWPDWARLRCKGPWGRSDLWDFFTDAANKLPVRELVACMVPSH